MDLIATVHNMHQTAGKLFEAQMNGHDITPTQAIILGAINDNTGASQTRLVNLTGVDRSTLADVVRRLGKKGLTKRARTKHDARAYAVQVTPEGRKMVTAARSAAAKAEKTLRERYPGIDKVRAAPLQAAE